MGAKHQTHTKPDGRRGSSEDVGNRTSPPCRRRRRRLILPPRWSRIADTAGRGDAMSCHGLGLVPRLSSPLSPSPSLSTLLLPPTWAGRGRTYALLRPAAPSLGSTPTAGDVPSRETRGMCCSALLARVCVRALCRLRRGPGGHAPPNPRTRLSLIQACASGPHKRQVEERHDACDETTDSQTASARTPALPADGRFVRGVGVWAQRVLAASSSVPVEKDRVIIGSGISIRADV